MSQLFPEAIRNLPKADIPPDGTTAYLSQSDTHQILFMQFKKDVELPDKALQKHLQEIGVKLTKSQ